MFPLQVLTVVLITITLKITVVKQYLLNLRRGHSCFPTNGFLEVTLSDSLYRLAPSNRNFANDQMFCLHTDQSSRH